MMAKGMERMLEKCPEWPPAAPGFRKLCLPHPEDYGLVSEQEGLEMALGIRSDKAPEVVEILRRMGSDVYKFKSEEEDHAKARWRKHYEQLVEDVAHGFDIPEPELQLEESEKEVKKLSKEEALKELYSMKSIFDEE